MADSKDFSAGWTAANTLDRIVTMKKGRNPTWSVPYSVYNSELTIDIHISGGRK